MAWVHMGYNNCETKPMLVSKESSGRCFLGVQKEYWHNMFGGNHGIYKSKLANSICIGILPKRQPEPYEKMMEDVYCFFPSSGFLSLNFLSGTWSCFDHAAYIPTKWRILGIWEYTWICPKKWISINRGKMMCIHIYIYIYDYRQWMLIMGFINQQASLRDTTLHGVEDATIWLKVRHSKTVELHILWLGTLHQNKQTMMLLTRVHNGTTVSNMEHIV